MRNSKEASVRRIEEIATATIGYKRYLNGITNHWYWSEYKEDDEKDDPDGGPFHATLASALGEILKAAGYLIDPATGQKMVLLIN